ncbi:nucleotidyl transferase AbiEii/AbiGii toxin family protein [Actinoplanes xinjiangensis]|uniref:nucleotidyl transferase AbiEii/AbiGii toxin family protein n=1 Tax=Actinoplanes xinjiangensis TaxID=512350 RepID=UPI00342B34C8
MTVLHEITTGEHQADRLASLAAEHGVAFRHLRPDHGVFRSQPMITVSGGTDVVREWEQRIPVLRRRTLGPVTADGRRFEHRIELRSEPERVVEIVRLADLVEEHGAALGRDPRRLIVQRCLRTTADGAAGQLDRLLAGLRAEGHQVVSVQRWQIVHDDNPDLDGGWLIPDPARRFRPSGDGVIRVRKEWLPPTFQPVPPGRGVEQRYVFDPALKQFDDAYRPGEPEFADPVIGGRWQSARQLAMNHLLTVLGGSRWAEHLVLRGSALMPVWAGAAARRPGDLDFVVTPPTVTSGSREARELLDGIRNAASGAGLRPGETAESEIWTYERADGRRLVIPFSVPGVPDGSIQIDVVFGEHLPIEPEPIMLPGVGSPILAATAELSLAWKLLWLATDRYPQGKDLYDAVLLAEHTTVDVELVRDLLLPELGDEALEFSAVTPLSWYDVDWDNFADEYPQVAGPARHWLRRLALALDRS